MKKYANDHKFQVGLKPCTVLVSSLEDYKMGLSKLHVVIVDDNGSKAREIRKVLERNGIRDVDEARDQEKLWEMIYGNADGVKKPDLIVTDMQYPLASGSGIDPEAGFKLIERMQKEQVDIPVIICSECNYDGVRGILGSVHFRWDDDLFFPFKEVLGRLK